MGIKGIYGELGPGRRVSLSKLAADSLQHSNRPFRVAIDIAIWQFQNQAARGGTNPAIRTLFYRLVRLIATPIQPVFVFDGPNKPKIKRNKRSGRGDGVATAQAKRLIRLFGFVAHDAPGEAEADCALLQRHGIVDAVLSEDVDTIMFGCTKTLRNWSAEGKSSGPPTHVSLYDVDDLDVAELGLDREGMVLVALMSGGDYLPDGIPGCGVKVACEAAKAGYGKSLCRLKGSDTKGRREWRESLIHELRTNEQGFFRTKHRSLTIPEDFPNMEVLGYYTHPVVSQTGSLGIVKEQLKGKQEVHLEALREFARETFNWDFREGAIKFIRVLGQALLVKKLCEGQGKKENMVERISGRRTHASTDSLPELRLSYIPQVLVPIDLSKEVEEEINYGRDGLALNSDEEFDAPASSAALPETAALIPKLFDAAKPDLAWVLEGVVKIGIPKTFAAWEELEQNKAKKKAPKKKATVSSGEKQTKDLSQGALDNFVRATKDAKASKSAGKKLQVKDASPQRTLERPSTTLRRPQTPTRFQSKPSLPTNATPSTSSINSSPELPRPSRATSKEHAIIILSSSPEVAHSPRPSITPSTGPSDSREVPRSIRSILSTEGIPQRVRAAGSKGITKSKTKSPPKAFNSAKWKQTTLDVFAKKHAESTSELEDPFEDSDPEPVIPQQKGTRNKDSALDLDDSFQDSDSEPALLQSKAIHNTELVTDLDDNPFQDSDPEPVLPKQKGVYNKESALDLNDPFQDSDSESVLPHLKAANNAKPMMELNDHFQDSNPEPDSPRRKLVDIPIGLPSSQPLFKTSKNITGNKSVHVEVSVDSPPESPISLPSPSSPAKRRQEEVARSRRTPSPTPVRKKMLVPVPEKGTFKEVEVDEEKYEEKIAEETRKLKARGGRGKVARYSEVELIDLTEDS